MKKIITILFAVLMVFAACSKPSTEAQEPSEPSMEQSSMPEEPEIPEEQKEPEYEGPKHLAYLREDFPKIDGSTSLIPLEAGIRAEIFGKTFEEATLEVEHTTTWDSFNKLLEGTVDMIFSVPLAEQQKQTAKEWGIELEEIPIAKEGFVFVVNANNPVDVLTQEQLRDIYSGKITNWKQVGGNDAEIIAYQRNYNSGSQNYMIEFMGDVPLAEAPTEKRPGSMAGLMNAVAINDNAENAIGYSVYAYAADMYGNGDEIKFIKVDGAEVSKKSMANGEYPLIGYNCAVLNSEKPEDSNAGKLVEWMLSDEGQLAIAKAGYVTIRDIGFDYSEEKFAKFEAAGTGIKKPEGKLPSYEYIAKIKDMDYYSDWLPIIYKDGSYRINCLKNKKLNDEINEFIAKALENAEDKIPEMEKYIAARNNNSEWEIYSTKSSFWKYMNDVNKHKDCNISVKAKNGYIWAEVYLPYYYNAQDGYNLYYYAETAVWDIESGKRLEVSDLFYEGTDIDEALNKYLTVKSQEKVDAFYYYEMKADFASLPKDGWHITPEGIYFDYGNPYFAEGVFLDFGYLPEGILVTEQPKNMEGAFTDNVTSGRFFRIVNHKWDYRYLNDEVTSYALLPEDSYPTAEKINAEVEKHLKENFSSKAVGEYAKKEGYSEESVEEALWFSDWRTEDYGGKYVIFEGVEIWFYSPKEGGYSSVDGEYPAEYSLIFDIETGEKIKWEDMFRDGWKEHCFLTDGVSPVRDFESALKELKFRGIINRNHETSTFNMGNFMLKVEDDYILW